MDKCFHCGEPLSKKDKVCPRCGADVSAPQEPKTIYELRWFCAQHNMPLAKMRFFLGEDYREPRAFGIYQEDDGDFVVYKNKADGSRAVRYKGPDEAHAVHEIYQKLLSEIARRKGGGKSAPKRSKKKGETVKAVLCTTLVTIAVMVGALFFAVWKDRGPSRGYYSYDDGYYYSQNGDWYYYDDDSWYPWEVDDTLREHYDDYYVGRAYDDEYGAEDFYYSDYYSAESDSDSDYTWDDDWDDDWDDWDDFDTDWDSDW